MLLRHSRLIAAASALLVSLASTAGAVVLWDQSNWNTNTEGSVNLSSNSCSQISGNTKVHMANDVHFSSPVHITTVRTYETQGNVQTATLAYLWIAPKTGTLPTETTTNIETAANQKAITSTTEVINGVTAVVVSAANLSIDLPAGDYWVSLTPRHNLGIFPYSVHLITTGPVIGDPTAIVVACTPSSTWLYPLDPNRPDYALKIEGSVPVPTIPSSWSRVKSIYR
jgi:hypothetical protein